MSALCCPRARTGPGWFSALKEALRRFFFSIEETPQPLQPSREKVNQRATALLDQYGEHILRLAYSYLHNQSDAEDILQDTLIQYLRTAPVLESPAHEKAWLLRVAGNLSKNLLRAQGYRHPGAGFFLFLIDRPPWKWASHRFHWTDLKWLFCIDSLEIWEFFTN